METDRRELLLESYIMPNAPISDSTPLTAFQVPPESIERSAYNTYSQQSSKYMKKFKAFLQMYEQQAALASKQLKKSLTTAAQVRP